MIIMVFDSWNISKLTQTFLTWQRFIISSTLTLPSSLICTLSGGGEFICLNLASIFHCIHNLYLHLKSHLIYTTVHFYLCYATLWFSELADKCFYHQMILSSFRLHHESIVQMLIFHINFKCGNRLINFLEYFFT